MLTLALLRGEDRVETTDADVYYDERLAALVDYTGPSVTSVQFEVVFIAKLTTPDPTTSEDSEFVTVFETTLEADDAKRAGDQLVWTPELHLRRPQFERAVTEVYVEISAVARGHEPAAKPADPQLKSYAPVGVASPFAALHDIFPPAPKTDAARPAQIELERQTLRARVDLSLSLSLRTLRPPQEADRDTSIAQITLVGDPALPCGIRIESVDLTMSGAGTVVPLGEAQLPVTLSSHAECAFAFSLDAIVSVGFRREIVVNIKHIVLDQRAPAVVETQWSSVVDFDDIKGPLPKTPTLNSTPRIGSDIDALSVRSVPRNPLSGVALTITGPNKVRLGDEFEWKIVAVNKSHRSRKICIYFHSREPPRPLPPRIDERPLVADLSALRQRVAQNNETLNADCGVVALTNELRIGIMAPQSSYEGRVKLKALSRGLHSVAGSAVVDLATGESYDTGELLNVIVE